MKNDQATGSEMSWMALETSLGGYSYEIGLEIRIAPFKSIALVQGVVLMRYIVGLGPLGWRTIENTAKNHLLGIFGEVEGANAGQLGEEASTDPHRYVH